MSRKWFLIFILLFSVVFFQVVTADAALEELIIETTADVDVLAAAYSASVLERIAPINLYRVSAESAQLSALAADGRVTAAYTDSELDARPSYFVGASDILAAVPTDSIGLEQYTEQDAADLLRIDKAHTLSTGSGIVVAVIDTGAESTHPLLDGKLTAGYDFVDNDTLPEENTEVEIDTDNDGSVNEAAGHGSHVAGIIALVAPDAQIMPLRVMDTNGRGLNFALAKAIVYATDAGVHIINLSGNSGVDEAFVENAINYAWDNGVVIITSAGLNEIGYPASYENAISVASTNNEGYRTVTSQFGAEEVDVYAPGELIMSAYYDGRYARWTGHSMATPFISGAAALMMATGSCDNLCVRDELLSYARWVDRYLAADEFLLADFYDAVGAAANQQNLDITVQSRTPDNDDPQNNTRKVQIKLNNAAHSIPLNELTIRYWYSNEDSADETIRCDWAAVDCSHINTSFGVEERSVDGLQYFELSFSAEAGNLFGSDSSGEIHIRTNHNNWANYDETDDYSYNASSSFTDWGNIGLYHNGELISGRSPNQSATSAIALASANTAQADRGLSGMSLLFGLLLTISTAATILLKLPARGDKTYKDTIT